MLPRSHLRFVLAIGISEGEVTLESVAVEGTKQVRPDALRTLRSGAADSAFGRKGGRTNRLRRDRNFEGAHPSNV